MNFYWVNIKGSRKEILDHGFLWAPAYGISEKTGKKYVHSGWKHVPEVKKGDVVFCHAKREIHFVAIATSDAYSATRPPSRVYEKWKDEGYKIDVDLEVLPTRVHSSQFVDYFIDMYNEMCSPRLFTVKKDASENYLTRLPLGAGASLLEIIGELSIKIQDKARVHGSQNSDTESKVPKSTQREVVTQARIGQGKFREDVLKVWDNQCPVTGVNMPELLIASHIVSWQLSSDKERVDKYNGLPLSPAIDKLFDKGFVSFSDSGDLLLHGSIDENQIRKLGISLDTKVRGLTKENKSYLERHRKIHNIKANTTEG